MSLSSKLLNKNMQYTPPKVYATPSRIQKSQTPFNSFEDYVVDYEVEVIDDEVRLKEILQQIIKDNIFFFDYETVLRDEAIEYFNKKEIDLKVKEKLINENTEFKEKEKEKHINNMWKDYEKEKSRALLDEYKAEPISIQFCSTKNKAYIIWDISKENKHLFDIINDMIFQNLDILKIAFNLKFEMKMSLAKGYYIRGRVADPLVMAIRVSQVLWPEKVVSEEKPYIGFGLKATVKNIINYQMIEYLDLTANGTLTFSELDRDNLDVQKYMSDDVICCIPVFEFYAEHAKNIKTVEAKYPNYYEWLENIECNFVKVLAQMEYQGFTFDEKLGKEALEGALIDQELIAQELIEMGKSKDFKISPGKTGKTQSVQKFIFEHLGVPVQKLTDKGSISLDQDAILMTKHYLESFGDDICEDFKLALHAIALIEKIQKIGTLVSSHLEGRMKYIHPFTGRIHSEYSPYVRTGRLNSSNPNCQNVPRPDNDHLGVRRLYKPAKGKALILIDFSGFELRLMAWAAREENMIEAFNNGEDLHMKTAIAFTNKDAKDVTKIERSAAKTVNFTKSYSGTSYAVQKSLIKIDLWYDDETCKKLLEANTKAFPGIDRYNQEMIAFAREHGFAETIFGYRRMLPNIRSSNYILRSSAERQAGNTKIQGSASDIMKNAQIKIYERIADNNDILFDANKVQQIAQIHDEVILEVDNNIDYIKQIASEVVKIMQKSPLEEFPVEIIAEPSFSTISWGDKEELKL